MFRLDDAQLNTDTSLPATKFWRKSFEIPTRRHIMTGDWKNSGLKDVSEVIGIVLT